MPAVVPGGAGGEEIDSTGAAAAVDTLPAPQHAPLWRVDEASFGRYAPRTWGDLFAGLAGSRADRFGPPGFFETVRVDGTGRPVIVFNGIPLPSSAGGLPDLNVLPRGGIGTVSLSTARLLPGLAVTAPGGVVELVPGVWKGGLPRSVVEAERGPNGESRYRFGFERGIGERVWMHFDVNVRRADSFVLESFDRREVFFRGGAPVKGDLTLEAGRWSSVIDEALFDPRLGSYDGMSHDGADDRSLAYVRLRKKESYSAVWYTTGLRAAASPRSEEYSAIAAVDNRSGAIVSAAREVAGGRLGITARYEKREARRDDLGRSRAVTALAAALDHPLAGDIRLHASVMEEFLDRGDALTGGEVRLSRKGAVTVAASALRARRDPTVEQWARGWETDGVVHRVEAAVTFEELPGKPRLRIFRREVDGERFLYSENGYFEEGSFLDERTTGFEAGAGGTWRGAEGEISYLASPVRAKGIDGRLPFQSDHLLRVRGRWGRTVPYLGMPGTVDLLGEWRSDRTAPGRSAPMDDYYYLRGRVTLDVSGANLYGQIEQITGKPLEYVDAPPPGGGDGALSGTFLVYVGVVWQLED